LLDAKGITILKFFKFPGIDQVSDNINLTWALLVDLYNSTIKDETKTKKLNIKMGFFEVLPSLAPFIKQGFLGNVSVKA